MKKRILPVLSLSLLPVLGSLASQNWDETATVGIASNRVVLPNSQTLTPAGKTTELRGMRPVTVAISPDGTLLATAGKTSKLVVLDLPAIGKPRFIPLPNENDPVEVMKTNDMKPDRKGQISYTGLVFSPDGKRIYLSNVDGSVKVFSVDGREVRPEGTWKLPGKASKKRSAEIPAGLAVSRDGKRLYVCGSLSNNLLELDTATGKVLRSIPVGMIPYEVALRGHTAYVSNRAGRRPEKGDAVETSGQGVDVRVEGPLALPRGTIGVVDLEKGEMVRQIDVGKQPSALAISPNGKFLVVANVDSDTLSIIDLKTLKVVNTPSVRWRMDDPFGASPTALAFRDKSTLLVCLGTQNAVAVFDFERDGDVEMEGMIPAAWFPSGIVVDRKNKMLHISNMKGLGSGAYLIREGKKARTRAYFGTLSHIPLPSRKALKAYTRQVLDNYRIDVVRRALLPPRPDRKPVPVPERSGEPSVFKHVVYIIRENRTYDQVLGDVEKGNGDKDLCVFGARVTPNIHKIVDQFVLLDNIYCSSILSADGHNWCLSAFANDYLERSFAGWPRAYPDGLNYNDIDVMAWSPQGFLWSAAAKAGKSVRVYGEMCLGKTMFTDPSRKGKPTFTDFFNDWKNGTTNCTFTTEPAHASVAPFLATNYPAWAGNIPDQVRADIFIDHLRACERGEAEFENLHILSVHHNHTSGTRPGFPTPAAAVADNDLALGRIIEAISKSRYWKDTVVFSIEDDPQAGWDHVSGYRTDCQVASAYTKRGAVVSDHFNQPGLIRTIGLILGFPPLNQMDAGSTPLRTCFTDTPDFTPYEAVPNLVPLDKLNPSVSALKSRKMRKYARMSKKMPFEQCDACDEDDLNHILWFAMKGPDSTYPDWAIIPENQRGDDDDDD